MLPEVEVSELQLGHRVHTPAQAGELRVVEAHVRQVELPGTVMNHGNIASRLVLDNFDIDIKRCCTIFSGYCDNVQLYTSHDRDPA